MIRKIAALIPCYNVEAYCWPVIEETVKAVGYLILVNDGSTDGTGEILAELARAYPDKIHLIIFPQNRGKGAGLLAGIHYALKELQFDLLVTLDSDGQHLPSEIGKLAAFIQGETQFVIGRRDFDAMPLRSRVGNKIISLLLHLVFSEAPQETQSGFRAFSRKFAEKIEREATGSRYEMEFRCILLALRDKDRIAECRIATLYLDENRSSHYSAILDSCRILKVLYHYWRTKKI